MTPITTTINVSNASYKMEFAMFSILRSAYGKFMEISKKNIVVCLLNSNKCKETVKNFMAPFYGWGSTVSRLEPL